MSEQVGYRLSGQRVEENSVLGIKPFIIFRFIIDLGGGSGGVARLYIHLDGRTDGRRRENRLLFSVLSPELRQNMTSVILKGLSLKARSISFLLVMHSEEIHGSVG